MESGAIDIIYKLSTTKLEEWELSILAESVIESLTKFHDQNSKKVYDYTQGLIQKDKNEKKLKAQAKWDMLLKKTKFKP